MKFNESKIFSGWSGKNTFSGEKALLPLNIYLETLLFMAIHTNSPGNRFFWGDQVSLGRFFAEIVAELPCSRGALGFDVFG